MMHHHYLMLKPWHPTNKNNQRRLYEAEQQYKERIKQEQEARSELDRNLSMREQQDMLEGRETSTSAGLGSGVQGGDKVPARGRDALRFMYAPPPGMSKDQQHEQHQGSGGGMPGLGYGANGGQGLDDDDEDPVVQEFRAKFEAAQKRKEMKGGANADAEAEADVVATTESGTCQNGLVAAGNSTAHLSPTTTSYSITSKNVEVSVDEGGHASNGVKKSRTSSRDYSSDSDSESSLKKRKNSKKRKHRSKHKSKKKHKKKRKRHDSSDSDDSSGGAGGNHGTHHTKKHSSNDEKCEKKNSEKDESEYASVIPTSLTTGTAIMGKIDKREESRNEETKEDGKSLQEEKKKIKHKHSSELERMAGRKAQNDLTTEDIYERFPWLKNAPVEAGDADNKNLLFRPMGMSIRNVRCLRCGQWGHQTGDRECPMRDQNPNDADRLRKEDPMSYANADRKDYQLDEVTANALGIRYHEQGQDDDLVHSDDEDYAAAVASAEGKNVKEAVEQAQRKKARRKQKENHSMHNRAEELGYELSGETMGNDDPEKHFLESLTLSQKRQLLEHLVNEDTKASTEDARIRDLLRENLNAEKDRHQEGRGRRSRSRDRKRHDSRSRSSSHGRKRSRRSSVRRQNDDERRSSHRYSRSGRSGDRNKRHDSRSPSRGNASRRRHRDAEGNPRYHDSDNRQGTSREHSRRSSRREERDRKHRRSRKGSRSLSRSRERR